jgi:hypothetical protein
VSAPALSNGPSWKAANLLRRWHSAGGAQSFETDVGRAVATTIHSLAYKDLNTLKTLSFWRYVFSGSDWCVSLMHHAPLEHLNET